MRLIEVNWTLTRRQGRQFGLLLLLAGAAAGGLLLWRGHPGAAVVVWSAAGVGGLASLAVPAVGLFIYRALMLIALPVGTVVSTAVMLAVYFLVIVPLGLAFRLVGRDELRLRHSGDAATYWERKSLPESKIRYLRQF